MSQFTDDEAKVTLGCIVIGAIALGVLALVRYFILTPTGWGF
jgi:hypothetical protein